MAYVVPGMTLIPQSMSMSCWYASMQMLIKWKEEQRQVSFADLISPEFDTQCAAIRDANTGIMNPQILAAAKRVGLLAVPPVTPTPEALEGWLQKYGPLWVNGKSHIVVIAGIMKMPLSDHMLLVYDPSPVNIGRINWRSFSGWYEMGSSVSTRDTGKDVEAVFLYVPDDL